MLHQRYPIELLRLIDRAAWRPYPALADRDRWEALPAGLRQSHIAAGAAAAQHDWPALPATRYLDFARDGNRSRFEAPYFVRRWKLETLAIAECLENRGRFVDDIVDGAWLVCEESSWCLPAHVNAQQAGAGLPDTAEPVVDLFAAETAALLAWTDYLLGERLDGVSPLIRPRLRREIETRVLAPCRQRDDFWWMGFSPRRVNNWNPWVNSNWLAAVLLMEDDPARRLAAVGKIMRSLDRFIDPYPKDGGCDEGPSYWTRAGASLFDGLELLHSATGGQVDVYAEPLIQNIGRFIGRVQIAGDYFVNFADAPAVVEVPAALVYRYGRRIGDAGLMRLGAWAARPQDALPASAEPGAYASLGRALPGLFAAPDLAAEVPALPLPRDAWLPDVQVMVARDCAGSTDGWCVAAKGGHNAESHNHNDVGNFVVYANGQPVIVDAGVETYTRKTFSDERYDLWTMQSSYHNLPAIGGVMQSPGETFAARQVAHQADENCASLTLDIAGAYPAEAKLNCWQRAIRLIRGRRVEIEDRYELAAPARDITLYLLTACAADVSAPGTVVLAEAPLAGGRRSGEARLIYDAGRFSVSAQGIAIQDEQLSSVWGDRLTRLMFTARDPALRGGWTLAIEPQAHSAAAR